MPKQLKSRKLWLAIIASAVAGANAFFDLNIKLEEVLTIAIPLMIYVGVEGAADTAGRLSRKE